MAGRRNIPGPVLLLFAALAATACSSRDERAATAAGIAADALQDGNIGLARYQITQALAAREDVGDYWMLSGRISLAEGKYSGAFSAFENALTLDRSNLEALTRLCQLAASAGTPERAERYANELLALHPGDHAAMGVQAAIGLERGDKAKAAQIIDQILATDPNDPIALIVRSHLLSSNEDYASAAKAAEQSLVAPGDPVGRLEILRDAYVKAGDADGWRRTIARLAKAQPNSIAAQLDYAQTLYDTGDRAGAFAVTRGVLAAHAGNIAAADGALHLWQSQGAAAMPVEAIVASAGDQPPETRAAFAAYANSIGKPNLALASLGDVGAAGPAGITVNDAKVARAHAHILLGHRDVAMRIIAEVLKADPDQPRALAQRGLLRAAAGDRRGAIEDLRHALAASPTDATTRLALADQQLADNNGLLAAQTLQDGLTIPDVRGDARLVTRLAQMLRAQGRGAEVATVLTDYARINPFAPRPAT